MVHSGRKHDLDEFLLRQNKRIGQFQPNKPCLTGQLLPVKLTVHYHSADGFISKNQNMGWEGSWHETWCIQSSRVDREICANLLLGNNSPYEKNHPE